MTTSSAPPRAAVPPVRGRDVLLVLAVSPSAMLVLGGLGVVLAATLVGARYALVLAATLGAVGAWGGLWLTLTQRLGWGWRELGFVRGRQPLWHLLWQVPAALLASLVCAAALGAALGLSAGRTGAAERDLLARTDASPWSLLVVATCAVLVLPAAEEVLFRRVLLDWALTRVPAPLAVVLTAAAFAAVHISPIAMTYLVFLGIFTALLRIWHDNLWAPLALHAVNNALVVLVVADVV